MSDKKIKDGVYVLKTRADIGDQPVDWINKAFRVAYTTEDLQYEIDHREQGLQDHLAYNAFCESEVFNNKAAAMACARETLKKHGKTYYGIIFIDMNNDGFPVSADMGGWG